MVDALSRLFGKSAKKTSTSTSSLNSPSGLRGEGGATPGGGHSDGDDEAFTMVGHPRSNDQTPGGGGASSAYSSMYPTVPPGPYPPATPGEEADATATLRSQASLSALPHMLEGVPFVLSPQYVDMSKTGGGSGGGNDADNALDLITERINNVHSMLRTTHYDFRLERSVIQSDISASLSRLQTN